VTDTDGALADGFDVVPVVIDRYANHPALDDASAEARAIVDLLARHLHGTATWWAGDDERTETSIKEELNAWSIRGERSSLLMWFGHGTSNGHDAWLATYETPSLIRYSGVNPQTIAEQITKQWQRRHPHPGVWAIVVVEACGAATFVRRVAAALLQMPNAPQRLALIGVGGDDSAGNLGQFRQALGAALDSYTDNDEHVAVTELVSNLRNRIEPNEVVDRGMHKATPLRRRRLLPTAVTVPMDMYGEVRTFLADLTPDERGHFIPKAQGAEHGELAWYFVGRHTERQRIVSWLHETRAGMLIVTGRAGSGKSALLGNVLVQCNPALTDLLARAGYLEPVRSSERPPAEPFDAIVHLTGVTTTELVARLASAARLRRPPRRTETGGDVDWLIDRLRERDIPFTVLTDALDEAQEPATIASSVLRRIAALPHVRVIVGTRASTHEGPDQPDPTDVDLLDALGRDSTTRVLTVERDPAAIATYVHRRLSAARSARLVTATDNTIADVSALVGGRDREFLFARLTVHEILAHPHLLQPDRRDDLIALLSADHRALFATAVRRLTATAPAFGPLLEALAFANGRGIPRTDRIWTTIANALAPSAVHVTETEVDLLLLAAAPYVMLDAEDRQSVYRLAHRTFQEHFLGGGQAGG
jgi:hypothetical protein